MQLNKTMRTTGISLSVAALVLLAAEGPAAAHEGTSSPDLRGRVTSVASGDFVIQKYDGTTETVDTTSGTTYGEPGTSVTLPGVQDSENVAITLDPSASSPTATNVVVFPERVSGRVSNVAGSTVTLRNRRGTDTVLVSPNTKYYEKGTSPTGVSDGQLVTAFGLPDATTPGDELDAQVVAIFGPAPQPAPQPVPTPAPATTPTTTAVTPGPQPGGPQVQPTAPQTPSAPSTTSWNRSTPGGASFPHGLPGGPGNSGGPGFRGGSPGGFGGQGGHR
jgi:hypothetical protein